MHFHGAYFANCSTWQQDPKHYLPSAQKVWTIIGQEILNSDMGGYFQGIYITSGLFQLWRSEGIVDTLHLKYGSSAALIRTLVCLLGSYLHMHIALTSIYFTRKFKTLSMHHLILLTGLGSISWSGHIIHIALPVNRLLDIGIDPALIPWSEDLLFQDSQSIVFKRFSIGSLLDLSIYLPKGVSITERLLNSSTGSIFLGIIGAHHLYLGLVLIRGALFGYQIAKLCFLGQI
jgi:photosystem I P700 chlorophyll a apoprotein A1